MRPTVVRGRSASHPIWLLKRPLHLGEDKPRVAPASWKPMAEIHEDHQQIIIAIDVPGVDPAALNIQIENNVLSVRGERQPVGDGPSYRERPNGRFVREFHLPESINMKQIRAESRFGVLEIVLPKLPEPQPRKIPVN